MPKSPKAKPEINFSIPADLSEQFSACIGRAASDWGALEFQINELIWELAAVFPSLGACITAQIFTVDSRLHALLSLLKVRKADKSLIGAINKFHVGAREPQELRNRIVHDTWTRINNTRQTARIEITAKSTLKFELRRVTLTEIRADLVKIRACVLAFEKIREKILDALSTLPGISRGELARIERALPGQIQTPSTAAK